MRKVERPRERGTLESGGKARRAHGAEDAEGVAVATDAGRGVLHSKTRAAAGIRPESTETRGQRFGSEPESTSSGGAARLRRRRGVAGPPARSRRRAAARGPLWTTTPATSPRRGRDAGAGTSPCGVHDACMELEEGGEGWRSAGEVAGGGRGGGDGSGRRGADAEWECGSTVRLCPRFFSHLYWVRGPRLISLRGLLRPGALVAWLRGSPRRGPGTGTGRTFPAPAHPTGTFLAR